MASFYEVGIDVKLPEDQLKRIEAVQQKLGNDAHGMKVALFGLTAAIAGLAVIDYMKGRR